MNIFSSLKSPRPENIFRPMKILRRLTREYSKSYNVIEEVTLPWGLKMRVRPYETIGSCIWRLGIDDLCVSESIWRLLDAVECSVDIGSNIGHMTSVIGTRVGQTGKVIAFEPHPWIYKELNVNVRNWAKLSGMGKIITQNIALSDHCGDGLLNIPDDFEKNRGLATLISDNKKTGFNGRVCKVSLKTLGQVIGKTGRIGVIKIDVEGHELEVLKGGAQLINGHAFRDIIFEQTGQFHTPITEFLKKKDIIYFI
ncbi:hypothetical protein ES705_23522 [subsurface metagenome]